MILRYFRLYANFLRFSFSKAAEFRVDFFFKIVMDLFYYAAHIGFFTVLFAHTGQIGTWNQEQMYIFLGVAFIIDALQMTIVGPSLWMLPINVNNGLFDYYLIRPVSPLFMASLKDIAVNSMVNLLGAIGFLVWAINNYSMSFEWWQLLLVSVFILAGFLLSYLLRLLFIMPVFFTQAPRGFENFYWGMSQVSERPDRIYKGWMRRIFTVVMPMALICSYPARMLLDPWDWEPFIHFVSVLAIFALIVRWLWSYSLRSYSSASS